MLKILAAALLGSTTLCFAASGDAVLELSKQDASDVVLSATELEELLAFKNSNQVVQGRTAKVEPLGPCPEGQPKCAYAAPTWERTLKVRHRVPYELTIAPTGGWFGTGSVTIHFAIDRGGTLQAQVVSAFGTQYVQGLRFTAATSTSSEGYLEILIPHRYGQTHPAQIRSLAGPIPSGVQFVNLGQDMASEGYTSTEIMISNVNMVTKSYVDKHVTKDYLGQVLHDSTADNWCAYQGGFTQDTHAVYSLAARFTGKTCTEICNIAASEVNEASGSCLAGNTRIAPPYFHGLTGWNGGAGGAGRWGSYYWRNSCGTAASGNGATYCCCTW